MNRVKKTLPKIEAEFKEYLPHNWVKEVYRQKEEGKYHKFVTHIPTGKRFRNNVQIDKFLSKNPDIKCDRDRTSFSIYSTVGPKNAGRPVGKGRGKPGKKNEYSSADEEGDDDDIQEIAVVPKLAAKNGARAAGNGKGCGLSPKKRPLDDEVEDTNGATAVKKGKSKAKAKPEFEEDDNEDDQK